MKPKIKIKTYFFSSRDGLEEHSIIGQDFGEAANQLMGRTGKYYLDYICTGAKYVLPSWQISKPRIRG